ncbi:hypothetical protein VTK26DRAFT_3892 [Humicola hyalothermophila]
MPASAVDALQATLESKGLTFHIKTGDKKWKCTLMDKATHERQKAERAASSSSVSTTGTTTTTTTTASSSSSSSTKSH